MKEKTVIKYFNKVLKGADKFDIFSINNILLKKDFNPKTGKDADDFLKLCEKIEKMSTKLKFFEYEGNNGWYTLSDKGRKAKELGGYFEYEKYIEKKELESENKSINISIENLNQGENKGVLIQGSSLEKSPIKNKVNAEPNNKPEQKSFVKKIFSSGWTLAFVMLVIEEITLGKIWDFICNMFE